MTVTLCEQCGQPLGAPHLLLEGDCVLDHGEHVERHVGLLCRRHYHWIDATLIQLEELFALRGAVVAPGSAGGDRVGAAVESSVPGRLGVMALTDRRAQFWREDDDAIPNVPGALESWLRLVEEERGVKLLPFQRAVFAVDRRGCVVPAAGLVRWRLPLTVTIRLLRRERHWIAAQPWIDDYVSDLAELHLALARGIGDSMWPKPIGQCPNCRRKLYVTVGVDAVTCKRCKASWEGVHLARLRLMFEQEAG